jgi:tetratricopeptide (TPR) repeat protein
MPSIVPGYEYDIFISYRQKDNKGDKWVSEFIDNLKGELESTFKEDISIYFDENPHDGLLETHDVEATLEAKLKCLVFIPIISRTYCDPRSFAWEHEFKAFIELASQDQFGLKVKLPNGNVTSRILPIKIHDLSGEDKVLLEKELGGILRAIEFIYKEPGVNKPLTVKDNSSKNLNRTEFKIQVNKVANAIDEIITGLKSIQTVGVDTKIGKSDSLDVFDQEEKHVKGKEFNRSVQYKLISGAAIFVVLIIVALLVYPKILKHDTLNKQRSSGERISLVVLPFRNMTNDSTLNIWQDGIQFNLIESLSNSPDLKVWQPLSTNNLLRSKGYSDYSQITPSITREISQNLDANVFIYGNINRAGEKIRIRSQLIDSKTEEVFRSFQLEGEVKEVLQLTDSLATIIKNFLIISFLKKEISPEFQTIMPNSIEAYKSFILGNKAFFNNDELSAVKLFSQSLKIDSNFIYTYFWLSMSYANLGSYDQAEKWCLKIYDKREQLPFEFKIWVNWIYAIYHEKSKYEELKYSKQLLEINDRVPLTHWTVGHAYYDMNQYNNAIPELEKTLEIYKSWNTKPLNSGFYELPIVACHLIGNYKKEKEILKRAFKDFPDDPQLIRRQAILSLSEKDTVSANRFIDKLLTIRKNDSWSEAAITNGLGVIYEEAGYYKRAEAFYRKAFSLETDNPARINNLAYFLIDRNINPTEGLELADKAVKLNPVSFVFLDTKGWGLFKLGKFEEALKFLEKSDSLKPIYNYDLSIHIQEVKKAIANQK